MPPSEKVPAAHAVQASAPGGAKLPSGQHTAAPGGEAKDAAQGMHAAEEEAPVDVEYVPAVQEKQEEWGIQ